MTLTQLKRKTFITATGMRRHTAWRPSLQVRQPPPGPGQPGLLVGAGVGGGCGPVLPLVNELDVAFGASLLRVENGFRKAVETLP